MRTVILGMLVALMTLIGSTQFAFAQKKNKEIKLERIVEPQIRDTVAVYAGDFKEDFLSEFFKQSGKIVFQGAEFKFVLSLVLSDTAAIEDVIVLGVDNPNVKERMQSIAKNLTKWYPALKEGRSIKSQITVPFSIKESEFILKPADLNKLVEKSKQTEGLE